VKYVLASLADNCERREDRPAISEKYSRLGRPFGEANAKPSETGRGGLAGRRKQ